MECACQMLVLIPKRNGEFRAIGIVEFICKVVLGVDNFRIGAAVDFHGILRAVLKT